MSYYSDQLTTRAGNVISGYIDVKPARTVPETGEVKLAKNQGFELDATYVYADLIGSSILAQRAYKPVTAKIIRSYINGSARRPAALRWRDHEFRRRSGYGDLRRRR